MLSDVARAVVEGSFGALTHHYARVFGGLPSQAAYDQEYTLAKAMEYGYDRDLADPTADSPSDVLHFDHGGISRAYYRCLHPLLRGARREGRLVRGVDKHIWGQDYERRLRSLFPTGSADRRRTKSDDISDRTRVSAVTQAALLTCRHILQSDKAVTGIFDPSRDRPGVFIPSPFFLAQRILTDPEFSAGEAYATAALRLELLRSLEHRFGQLDLSFASVVKALDLIRGRVDTSKEVRAGADSTEGTALFLCHYLSMKGKMALYVDWSEDRSDLRVDRYLANPQTMFSFSSSDKARRGTGFELGFRLHPQIEQLPDASELLNELQGLPLPIEGADVIFNGGLRFATGGDIVIAISGTFGAGKTTTCLSIASSLAPLGCRTLFLTCEEAPEDIEERIGEAAPEHLFWTSPLIDGVTLREIRDFGRSSGWFRAHKLRIKDTLEEVRAPSEVLLELEELLSDAVNNSSLFAPFRPTSDDLHEGTTAAPAFARPIVIVDGFHQLLREAGIAPANGERALRRLIDSCRGMKAVIIFTVARDIPDVQSLDYLCDLVVDLDRTGFDEPHEFPRRILRLLKARRQPSRTGAHRFHIGGPGAFRVKPSIIAQADNSRASKWLEPDPKHLIHLSPRADDQTLRNRSQILVYGKGSSGKAGFGLYLLNQRPTPASEVQNNREFDLFEADEVVRAAARALHQSDGVTFYESRILVVSFLYESSYYRILARRLRTRRSVRRVDAAAAVQDRFPDRVSIDVVALYPGGLSPEDLLAKVEKAIQGAELRGIPYTGVLIDGIHNVFVQFPALEHDIAFWPQLYSMLRRRGVSVVTTHTEFELRQQGAFGTRLDLTQTARKASPLASVLVSASDYVFDLSTVVDGPRSEIRLASMTALGEDPPSGYLLWNRQALRLGARQFELDLSTSEQ